MARPLTSSVSDTGLDKALQVILQLSQTCLTDGMVAMLKFLAVVSAETHCTRTAERMVGVTLEVRTPDDRDDDRHSIHSIASTVATTTSLASRIRDLNLFDEVDKDVDKDGDRTVHSPLPEDPEEERAETSGTAVDEESTSRAGALSEEDLSISQSLHLLHRDPPLQVSH